MDPRLREASRAGNIDALYALIQEDPYLLQHIDQVPFFDTPLHIAASAGKLSFAVEIMNLKPSFARKLNQFGFSPLHLALQNNHIQLVLRLVSIDKDLVRVKGKEGITPLHFVTRQGNLDVLVAFLNACPDCIEDVNVRGETALHIALQSNMLEAFEVLLGWLQKSHHEKAKYWENEILNWKDDEGNTILHIAAARNLPKVIELLLQRRIDKNAKNLEGLTALDILQLRNQGQVNNRETTTMLAKAGGLTGSSLSSLSKLRKNAHYFQSRITYGEKLAINFARERKNMSSDMRNALLVVAVLIITATFQASLSPPGGVWQGDSNNPSSGSPVPGTTVMKPKMFRLFVTYNTITLWSTLLLITYLLPSGFPSYLLLIPLSVLGICYILSMNVLSANPDWFPMNLLVSAWIALPVFVVFKLSVKHEL
ncbi:hypothetical protein PTKIN_Ptkin16aG0493800 [Pterospermum kingtungense]